MKTVVLILLFLFSVDVFADEWTTPDKAKHLAAGALIGSTTTIATKSPYWGIAFGTAAGLGKEFCDTQKRGGYFSTKDLTVTAVGAVAGSYGSHWIFGPDYIMFRTEW